MPYHPTIPSHTCHTRAKHTLDAVAFAAIFFACFSLAPQPAAMQKKSKSKSKSYSVRGIFGKRGPQVHNIAAAIGGASVDDNDGKQVRLAGGGSFVGFNDFLTSWVMLVTVLGGRSAPCSAAIW